MVMIKLLQHYDYYLMLLILVSPNNITAKALFDFYVVAISNKPILPVATTLIWNLLTVS